ncbi:prefoldin subunit alpha [Candidatus Harpocratesius sp.]
MSQPQNNTPIDINQLIYIYRVLQDQQAAIIDQLNLLDTQIHGVKTALTSMQGLKEVDKEHEIIINIGVNAYTYAKIIDPNKILISIGKDMVIEKSIDDAMITMSEIQKKYENIREKLNQNHQEISLKIKEIQPIIDQTYKR